MFIDIINSMLESNLGLYTAWLIILCELQGETSVALYGLGNIRDERLNRMFQVFYIEYILSVVYLQAGFK